MYLFNLYSFWKFTFTTTATQQYTTTRPFTYIQEVRTTPT